MNTFWDDFLEKTPGALYERDRRKLLKAFYMWLVREGVITDDPICPECKSNGRHEDWCREKKKI